VPILSALVDLQKPLFFTLDAVLSPAECDALIARIDAAGPTIAPITRSTGAALDPDTRNNTRVMFDDPPLAALLFDRVHPRLPEELSGMHVAGANERLRCYRYAPGERFAPHYDGYYARSEDERSLLTFMVYLNEGFTGGETALLDLDHVIVPKKGMALLFQHRILHEGCAVISGTKYVVRSDIMYRQARAA
jgi:prolyl 4-hydroxylase